MRGDPEIKWFLVFMGVMWLGAVAYAIADRLVTCG